MTLILRLDFKDEPKNEWEGEDEGLDLTVSV